jgi:DNA-binding HxlR family transcriptional regulator
MAYQPDFLKRECPSRYVMALLADKWSLLILAAISRGINRNGSMLREIGDISQKMLTQTLRSLERHGLIERVVFDVVPPHVEYGLTPIGKSLIPVIQTMGTWAEEHYPEINMDLVV